MSYFIYPDSIVVDIAVASRTNSAVRLATMMTLMTLGVPDTAPASASASAVVARDTAVRDLRALAGKTRLDLR